MANKTIKLEAKFRTNEDAKTGARRLKAFLSEVSKAYWYWQDNRSSSARDFWAKFKAEFPNAYAFLAKIGKADVHPENLAGRMSFVGQEGDEKKVRVKGRELKYGTDTWHLADFNPLCDYVVKTLGAEQATNTEV